MHEIVSGLTVNQANFSRPGKNGSFSPETFCASRERYRKCVSALIERGPILTGWCSNSLRLSIDIRSESYPVLRWRLSRTYESFKPRRNNPENPSFSTVSWEQVRALTFAPEVCRALAYLTRATRPSIVHTINLQAHRTCRKLVSEKFAPEHRYGIANHKMRGKNLRFVCISRR